MNSSIRSLTEFIQGCNFSESTKAAFMLSYQALQTEEELNQILREIGEKAKRGEEIERLILEIEERVSLVKHKLKFVEESQKPDVVVISALDPPVFNVDPYVSHCIQVAGAKLYEATVYNVQTFDPSIILVLSGKMEKMFGSLANILTSEKWVETKAVKNNRVYLIDGEQHFRGMDLGVASDIEILAEIFYPQFLTFGGEGESWVQFTI